MSYVPHESPLVELVRQAMASAVATVVTEPELFTSANTHGKVIAELPIFTDLAENFVNMRTDLTAAWAENWNAAE